VLLGEMDGLAGAPSTRDFALAAGAALHRAGRGEDALAIFESITEHTPEDFDAWMAVAAARADLNRPWAALLACNRGLELRPEHPDALTNTALVLLRIGDLPAAEFVARKALACGGGFHSLLALAQVLARSQRPVAAEAAYREYLAIRPDNTEARLQWADTLIAARRFTEARESLAQILHENPGTVPALLGLAYVDAIEGDEVRSGELIARARESDPAACKSWRPFLMADMLAGVARLDPLRFRVAFESDAIFSCEWSRRRGFRDWLVDRLARDDRPPLDDEDTPFVSLGLEIPPELRLKLARQVAAGLSAAASGSSLLRAKRGNRQRLRIGYLSGDMRLHPVGRLFSPAFALHDRERFEVHVYHTGPREDCLPRRRAEQDADVFRDVERWPADALAQLIASDGIDVLVDLSGYTRYSATEALALRPAPVQVHYLGYLGTLGAPFVDYSIADRHVLPDNLRPAWSEAIAFLPHTMIPCDGSMVSPGRKRTRHEHGLPENNTILACLNATWKIEPEVFAAWMRILARVPASTLWLFDGGVREARENLKRAAREMGVEETRLVFADQVPYEDYLERYHHVDLVLNTRVYSGNTTTLEALANGVPVLCFTGDEMQSRLAAGIVSEVGLGELVQPSIAAYEQAAIELATSVERRASLQRRVREGVSQSTLFRIDSRVRELEVAYETMWRRHLEALPPADFDVQ